MPEVPEPTASDGTTIESKRFRIANMDCASEESNRRALEEMAGIRSLRFNPGIETCQPPMTTRCPRPEAIRKAGFRQNPGAKNVQRFPRWEYGLSSEESEIRRAFEQPWQGIAASMSIRCERELAIPLMILSCSRRWTRQPAEG